MALKQVLFTSRREAESNSGARDWGIISVSDPFHYPAMLRSGWHAVLRLEFSDIDQEDKPRVLFTRHDAQMIVDFVKQLDAAGCNGVLVHCKAGVSRSAAIAKWIAERYQLPFDENYSGFNRHIYSTLCHAGNTTA